MSLAAGTNFYESTAPALTRGPHPNQQRNQKARSDTLLQPIRVSSVVMLLGLAACASSPSMKNVIIDAGSGSAPPPSVTVPIIIESDQILVELVLARPDGATRKALAVVNMGLGPPYLQNHLYRELTIDKGRPLSFRIGSLPVAVESAAVVSIADAAAPERQFGPWSFSHRVEAGLQAGILQHYELVLDYAARTLTLARPNTQPHDGIAVPIRVNEDTGLVSVDVTVDGRRYAMVIDCGSSYSWARGSVVAAWLKAHPDWERAQGAVGRSNYNMLDYAFEKEGTVIRIPSLAVGGMLLRDVGIMGNGPTLGWPWDNLLGEIFWDRWQKSAPEPVVGWLGANVLKHYRLTIDYADRMSYWVEQSASDPHELDQVGVTLVYRSGNFVIGGIVRKAGRPTLDGLAIGDEIIWIDGQPTNGWSREQIWRALGGAPGDRHRLVVERGGKAIEISAEVAAF